MDLRPSEVTAILQRELEAYRSEVRSEGVGTVLQVGDGVKATIAAHPRHPVRQRQRHPSRLVLLLPGEVRGPLRVEDQPIKV